MPRNSLASVQNANSLTVSLPWDTIDTVLLDMDGTLLDLNYDNRVWNELIPLAFARRHNMPVDDAKQMLLDNMARIRGTISFYSFDYWSEFTDVDLIAVHHEATELLGYRPGALSFLRWLKGNGKHVILATNADRASLDVKHKYTEIADEVDAVVSSHDYGLPKEHPGFWLALNNQHGFTPANSLFVDDNIDVLDAANLAGVGYLLCVATPDSARPARLDLSYPSFDDFNEICMLPPPS